MEQPTRAAPNADILIGWCIDERYELEELVGRGRASLVFRARDLKTDSVQAVKLLFDQTAGDDVNRAALRASRIDHPGIGRVYAAGRTEEDIPYLIAELHDGRTIAELLEQEQLARDAILRIGLAAAEAVGAAHAQGVVHANIKASNVIVTRSGDVKVIDFGRRGAGEARPSRGGSARLRAMLNLVDGRTPDRSRIEGKQSSVAVSPADPREDVRALALLLLHMMVPASDGSRATEGDRTSALCAQPGLAAVVGVVLAALSSAPERRQSDANELARELRRAMVAETPDSATIRPPPLRLVKIDVAESLIGRTLGGRYHVQAVIGRGSTSVVFRARHLELGSPVAIKVLSPAATMDDAVQDRFRFEAQVLAGLRHPNIVNVFDLGEGDEGVRYIAMELLQGETLARLLERQNRLECGAAVRIVCQVAEALDTLHQRGLIHRDVKPANVFVVRDDVGQEYVKLMDFGLVRAQTKTSTAAPDAGSAADHDVPRRRQNTQRGTILGSGAYMSPELILGERLDARSDVYALGVMAYRMLTGALPFNAADLRELIAQHVSEPVEPLRKRAPDARIPDALEGVILRALAKTAGERQATAREFARELRSAWFEEPTAPSATHGSVGAPRVDRAPSIGAGRGVTLRFGTPSLEMPGSQSVRIAHRQSDVENPGYRGASRAISVPASMLADDSMGGISVGATSAPNSGIVPLVSPARSSGSGSRRLAVAWSAAMTSLVLAGGLAVYALVGLGSPGRSGAAETAPNLVASGLPSGPPVPQAPAARSSHVVNTIGGPESGRARPVASVVTASRFAAPKPISEDGPRDAGAIRSRAPRSESSSERIPSPRRKPAEANDPKAPSERPAIGSDDELKAPVWR